MNSKLKEKTVESLAAVLPITAIVLLISISMAPMDLGTMVMFLVGAAMLIVGMGLFQLGAELSMTPLGEGIGVQITKSKIVALVALITFLMGVIITISEPDLQILAEQVPAIPNMTLILTVALGVGVFLAMAVLRIIYKVSLSKLLLVFYVLMIIFSFLIPKEFIAVAFDSGGVTTGPMTVPFIMALGVGLASTRSDRGAADDSFGLVAMSSIGPILMVMVLGCFYSPKEAVYSTIDISNVLTTRDVAREFAKYIPQYAEEVLLSIAPIAMVFVAFQLLCKRYSKRQLLKIAVGLVYTYMGLVLFLCGVNVGFAPLGAVMGEEIAGLSYNYILLPIGALIGYYIVKAEPAIQILNHQVEDVTNGSISAAAMNRCMSIGVAFSIGLAMFRILAGIPLQWILIPGYVVALALSFYVPPIFVGIAFDSGGVASGPMTTTFLLPLSIGVCSAVGGNLMTDAFGVVAMVALTPLIAIQLMGAAYRWKSDKQTSTTIRTVPVIDDGDDIVEFEEDEDNE